MKKFIQIAVVVIIAIAGYLQQGGLDSSATSGLVANSQSGTKSTASHSASTDEALKAAYANQTNGLQIKGEGKVKRVLPDDNDGSRHQRFILTLASGQALLVAHNIDLAPRIDSIKAGDTVSFNGVYEWNEKGGVIHWTHGDPAGRHEPGWLKHRGKTYQ